MNTSTWRRLVESLLHATRDGTAHWEPSGNRGDYVLARGGGSVVFRTPSMPGLVTAGGSTLELLDADGDQLAELRSSELTSVVAGWASLMASGEDVHTSLASPEVAQMMDELLDLLRQRQIRAEQLALGIIAELDT